jgi:hypothetical protein
MSRRLDLAKTIWRVAKGLRWDGWLEEISGIQGSNRSKRQKSSFERLIW